MANRPLTLTREAIGLIAAKFPLHGKLLAALPYGSGHINHTLVVSYDQAGAQVRYIFQRINHHIFKNVPQLMENISRVTSHLAGKALKGDNRLALTLVPTHEGEPFYKTPEGDYWRVYLFIENARTYDVVENPRQAFEAAHAFGLFQQALADLPGDRLHETIPDFHNTPKRLEALCKAADADVAGRKNEVLAELDFAFQRESDCGRLLELVNNGEIAERITHNDTKLNNVMIHDVTGKLMTYEVGIRFLTDYLQGDIYFKTKRPGHNLDRARNQLRLVERIEALADVMEEIVSLRRLKLKQDKILSYIAEIFPKYNWPIGY